MKLKMLLWFLARRMELLTRTHPEFIAHLHGREFVIQIQTTDAETVRYYQVRHNRVTSHPAAHEKPDLCMAFANDEYGFKVLTSPDKSQFMVGMQEQKIKIDGDFNLLMWFMGISKYLKPRTPIRRSKRPKAKAAA